MGLVTATAKGPWLMLLVCLAGAAIVAPSANCGSDWEEDKTSAYCYQIRRDRQTWTDAQSQCIKVGGKLVSIHSNEQQLYLTGKLQSMNEFFWIGASDQTSDGGWRWADKSPFAYTNWDVNQPNNERGQNCLAMVPGTGKWNSLFCSLKYGYICAKIGLRRLSTIGTTTSPTSAPSGKQWGCPQGWKGFRDSCYRYVFPKSTGFTWDFARTYCQAIEQAELVSISDQAENEFVYSNSKSFNHDGMWIGLNDKVTENTFVWSDNTLVTYTNWARNEPNNNDEKDCVVLNTGRSDAGRWKDFACSSLKKLMACKKSKAFLNTTSDALTKGCPKNTIGYQDKCYLFSGTARTFSDAEKYCKKSQGHLATIPNNYVQAFLSYLVSKRVGTAYWIGLSTTTQNAYTWTSGSPLQFTNWGKGQPDRETHNCVAMQVAVPPGVWKGHDCTISKLPLVCEIPRVGYTAPPTQTTATQTTPCPSGWLTRDSMCYKAFGSAQWRDLLTWDEARTKCESFANGGTLASIGSHALSSWLSDQIISSNVDRTFNFWIGLNNKNQEGGFKWTDGAPVTWTHWDIGEPNNVKNRENCVEIDLKKTGKWHDTYCILPQNYICEVPRGSALNTPIPTVSLGRTEEGTKTIQAENSTPTRTDVTGGQCGNSTDWTYFSATNKCYFVSPETGAGATGSWFEAQQFCHAMGAELTSIQSQDESKVIFDLVSKSLGDDIWIGMNAIDSNSLRWVDGSPVVFSNWNIGEPDNYDGIERCVEMTSNGLWNDENCSSVQGYVCKRGPGHEHPSIPPTSIPKVRKTVVPTGSTKGMN